MGRHTGDGEPGQQRRAVSAALARPAITRGRVQQGCPLPSEAANAALQERSTRECYSETHVPGVSTSPLAATLRTGWLPCLLVGRGARLVAGPPWRHGGS